MNGWKIAAVLAVLLVAAGCGGGGGSRTSGAVSSSCLSYAPASGPVNSTVVTSRGSGSSCSVLELEFVITGVTDVFTGSFTVNYDSSFMNFDSASVTGSHLASDGATLDVQESSTAGQVDIGVTRIRPPDNGIDFTAPDQVLIKTVFVRTQSSGTAMATLTITDGKLLGSETPPVEKPGITWHGGDVILD